VRSMSRANSSKQRSHLTKTMNTVPESGGRNQRPPFPLRDGIEFVILAALSLITIFVIIPAETTSGDEIGLSPGLVPTVCAAVIGLLACGQFLNKLINRAVVEEPTGPSPLTAICLICSTIIGILAIRYINWEVGGVIIVVLVSLSLHERRALRLAVGAVSVALFLYIINHLGI